jgi:superfamily II DNA or RNA helicase
VHYSPHQLAYFAHKLTLKAPTDSMDRMAGALLDAQVDLNPHQIDAALFATSNPLSKGTILADEVGLGKTIEAGLLIAQRWAERKRRILVIVPANLRKQWHQELADKFGLVATILEAKSFRQALKEGASNPFEAGPAVGGGSDRIVICSYQFAAGKAEAVRDVPWDLVVIDEAHRLRNVYKPDNKIARTLRDALSHARKVLLTATPLQNSLLELYGLVSFIDERVFGDLDSFRQQFGHLRDPGSFDALKHRINPICKRTLRRQVEAYVKYTQRIPLLREFKPSVEETRLYDLVSGYLQRENLFALPNSQRQLITLVLRKLLASSTFAIAGALESLLRRLKQTLDEKAPDGLVDELDKDYESLSETADERGGDEADDNRKKTAQEVAAIRAEIVDLEGFRELAVSITENAKGLAMLQALKAAFERLHELGATQKALIFTESRRTQNYLLSLLSRTEYADSVVLFNGSNSDPSSRRIYADWMEQHKGSNRVSGSRTADTRAALVDYFRECGKIMIATEAGAEGINLQFCSLVINYDLPWNPQRIEQRIGRCHRYGQKHDVVVVNFLNRDNDADRRVYELLDQKFKLFDGVFGASDEVLGAVESGVDFERRIADIYQNCRHPTEIHRAFEQLQLDLAGEINDAMLNARKVLLENFDEEVQERLRIAQTDAKASLDRLERLLMRFTRAMLEDYAEFDGDDLAFTLKSLPPSLLDAAENGVSVAETAGIPLGRYELPRRSDEAHVYRLHHRLAQSLLRTAERAPLEPAKLHLNYEEYGSKVSVLEALRGTDGVSAVQLLRVHALGATEEFLLAASVTAGQVLDAELTDKLLALPGRATPLPRAEMTELSVASEPTLRTYSAGQPTLDFAAAYVALPAVLQQELSRQRAAVINNVEQRNLALFSDETEKLDAWADDLKVALEREIKELDRSIKETRTRGKSAPTLAEKLAAQRDQRELERLRDGKRRELFARQDEIQGRRDRLIEELEAQLDQHVTEHGVLCCEWTLS